MNAEWESGSRFMSADSLGPVLGLERAENLTDEIGVSEEVVANAQVIMKVALDEFARAA